MKYPSIRIEGAILSPDILERLEDLAGQRPGDFGLETNAKVKDEIARAWADAQDYWRIFQRKLEAVKPDAPATTETRQQWIIPLLGLLGYQLEYQPRGVELNGKIYAISHRVVNRGNTPIHVIGCREPAGLDRKPEKVSLRMSAHAMVQEYINLRDELFALVTNGRLLRLLRDSSRLIKLTYLEFDLDRIFTEGLFADFAILYRLLHASRLPVSHETATESIIERYHQDSLDSGARIRDGLAKAVEQAILSFANGFLFNQTNTELRDEIRSGTIQPQAFYQYLLRLIYRLLFLMVIEERGLVFPLDNDPIKRTIYERYYSVQRLRRLSEKRHLADSRRRDLWLSLLATFRLFEDDGPGLKLDIAPLAGDLFDSRAIGTFSRCTLGNDVLLNCLRALSLYRHPDSGEMIRVNYGALNVEEFGSVYEGLLEYSPVFMIDEKRIEFAFAEGDERATTGSHYTPDDLVQPLIKHSLDYLIVEKLKDPQPEQALLSLRVADISCGSGHILLAVARRIATELAIVRTGEEQPSPTAFRAAVRDVIRECIYGVDLNPLAVELCKVALWLEAHTPGQPLNFLDHHIKCGNAIVGFSHREELERGVPDEAFATMPGDDKKVAAEFRKRNKKERSHKGQITVDDIAPEIQKQFDTILSRWQEVSKLPEKTPKDIETKKQRYFDFTQSENAWLLGQIAAIPVAQFYQPKTEQGQTRLITDEEYRRYLSGERRPQGQSTAAAWALSHEQQFFHWFLEFPEILENGGFDCILGNPPYLGGTNLSSTYGYPFCHYVKWEYAPTGLSDLVVYFARRIYNLLRPSGFTAFITTNSIKDGDIRKDGLEQILLKGGSINFAVRGIKWPGEANLVVSLLSIYKGNFLTKPTLDNKKVKTISSYLDESIEVGEPCVIFENHDSLFEGYKPLGKGFYLTEIEAKSIISEDKSCSNVIFRIINGKELNNNPDQQPTEWIINFFDLPYEKVKQYRRPCEILYERVKPFRDTQNRASNRERWWRYGESRPKLTKKLTKVAKCFVTAATTKHLNFSAVPTTFLYSHAIKVFTTDRWDLFSVVQSTLHEVWARKYSGALETRLRYSPSDCFETFPFPEGLWRTVNPNLAEIGEQYHEFRRSLMLRLWLGLTNIYNLFNNRDLTPAIVAKVSKKSPEEDEAGFKGILQLRHLHRQLDVAVRDAYGWTDLDLEHDFHEVETLPEKDCIRYTISPTARKEVLKRLLALNHQRAAEKKEAEAAKPAKTVKRGPKPKINPRQGNLFAPKQAPSPPDKPLPTDWSHLPDGAWAPSSVDREGVMGAALVAVLKAVKGPTPIRLIRMATMLSLEPRLLTPSLTKQEAASWIRLVGTAAKPRTSKIQDFVPSADRAWGEAVRTLRGNKVLTEDLTAGTWVPEAGLETIFPSSNTDGWPDGCVRFILQVLARLNTDEVVREFPEDILRWVNAEAA